MELLKELLEARIPDSAFARGTTAKQKTKSKKEARRGFEFDKLVKAHDGQLLIQMKKGSQIILIDKRGEIQDTSAILGKL
jgi:hypothetical protein